jgi:hypothetical protein
MNTYYLRSTTTDWPELLNLGVLLGEIQLDEQGNPHGPGFVVVNHNGYVYKPTGETVTDEDDNTIELTAPVLGPDGLPYMHANLRTSQNLGEKAAELAESHPELAEALSNLGKYFLIDEEGKPRTPANPAWVFA